MKENKILVYISAAVISFTVMFSVEVFMTPLVFMILSIGYHIQDLMLSSEEDDKEQSMMILEH